MTREDALKQIEAAFGDAPRPADDDLLHEACYDDNDISSLYGIRHWRNVPDEVVEYEYTALAFLSPAGFRHFLPAYMSYALRHPESDAVVIESTVFALTPLETDLRDFMVSKFSQFDEAQRQAVIAFLEAMDGYVEVDEALVSWRGIAG